MHYFQDVANLVVSQTHPEGGSVNAVYFGLSENYDFCIATSTSILILLIVSQKLVY